MHIRDLLFIGGLFLGEAYAVVNPPAIGFELECRSMEFVNKDNEKAAEQDYDLSAKVKGKPFKFEGHANFQNWQLTAETLDDSVRRLTGEIVVSGPKGAGVPLTQTSTNGRSIGTQIESWLKTVNPIAGKKATVEKFESGDATDLGEWTITKPSVWHDYLAWGAQLTAPFPLSGLQHIVGPNVVAPFTELLPAAKRQWYTIVEGCHMGYQGKEENRKTYDGNEDVLGFMTLLMGYIKAAKLGTDPDKGPKHSSAVMPRTDFRSIYSRSVKAPAADWIKKVKAGDYNTAQAKGYTPYHNDITDFSTLVEQVCYSIKLCTSTNTFDNMDFTWEDWHNTGFQRKTLTVREWINNLEKDVNPFRPDLVTQYDKKYQAGQIGGLTHKMEHSTALATKVFPIFEFRDLGSVSTSQLAAKLAEWEKIIQQGHLRFGNSIATKRATTSSKTKASTKTCPLIKKSCPAGQTLQKKKDPKTGKTVEKCACPSGQKTQQIKDPKTGSVTEKCVAQCSSGQTLQKTKDPKTGKTVEKCACPAGSKLQKSTDKTGKATQKCTCAKGKTLKAGKCVASNTCTGGQTLKTTKDPRTGKTTQKCACPSGTTLKSGKCQKAACPSGSVMKGTKCQKIKCPSGSVVSGSKCMKVKCPAGAVQKGAKCVKITCRKGTVLKGTSCRKITCPSGSTLKGTKCQRATCPKGSTLSGGKCKKQKPAVKKCPAGSKKSGGRCVSTKKNPKSKCTKLKNLKKKAACEAASGAVGLF